MIKNLLILLALSNQLSGQPVSQHILFDLPAGLVESSGLEQDSAGNFWSHNDSGNAPVLYYFDPSGTLLSTIKLSNAVNTDWEDIALGEHGILYVGDIGNNDNQRQNLRIYKVVIGTLQPGENLRSAEEIKLSYQNQTAFPPADSQRNFDAEAMVYRNDSLFIFTKNRTSPFTGLSYQYSFPAHSGEYALLPVDSLFISGNEADARITGADLSSGGELALLATTKILIFQTSGSCKLAQGLPEIIPILDLTQKEGICWGADSCTIYLTDEYVAAFNIGGKFYEFTRCEPNSLLSGFNQRFTFCVYPNPTQDLIRIKFNAALNRSKIVHMRVISIAGSEVEYRVEDTSNERIVYLNNCITGIYKIFVINNDGDLFKSSFQIIKY